MIPACKVGKKNWHAFRATGSLKRHRHAAADLPYRLRPERRPRSVRWIRDANKGADIPLFAEPREAIGRAQCRLAFLSCPRSSNGLGSAVVWYVGCRANRSSVGLPIVVGSCGRGRIHGGGQTNLSISGGNKNSALIRKANRPWALREKGSSRIEPPVRCYPRFCCLRRRQQGENCVKQ